MLRPSMLLAIGVLVCCAQDPLAPHSAFIREAALRTGKVVSMIQSGIHAGEIEGKDTVLMLLRDMTVSKRYAASLDPIVRVWEKSW